VQSPVLRAFAEYDARLSRYSYLVALLPDQIVSDLGINFQTINRDVSSHTPYEIDGKHDGLTVAMQWDDQNADSCKRLTGSEKEGIVWQEFYSEIAEFAKRSAPSMLKPLMTRAQMREEIAMDSVWEYMIEKPIGQVIEDRFKNDVVRGVVLTDALIGTFVDSMDIQANICFLYHLIGNGVGQWKVPRGGMGALVIELERTARSHGLEIILNSPVNSIISTEAVIKVGNTDVGEFHGQVVLFAAAPQPLPRLRGRTRPASLPVPTLKTTRF